MKIFDLFKKEDGLYANLSKKQYKKLIQNETLKPMYLIDTRFGGSTKERNLIYVPSNIVNIKNEIDDELEIFVQKGMKVTDYECNLRYKGKSYIPKKIEIKALIDDKEYIRNIEVW